MALVLTARGVLAGLLLTLASCATGEGGLIQTASGEKGVISERGSSQETSAFERDRAAILAMAGSYRVVFDFRETVAFADGYELKDPYRSGGDELVLVVEDRGDFISLQHILVVGEGDEKFPIKHWRQDWRYEPSDVLVFIGGNAWDTRDVGPSSRAGRWSQTVYQVDDSPRYGALGAWSHANGVSQWISDREWRPLPRREMTTRADYHAVDAVNAHAVTPEGWVHEQNNSKLVLRGGRRLLAREIGVNTYRRHDDFDMSAAEDYWVATKDYWAAVRARWTAFETAGGAFGLTLKGEPADLYTALFEQAEALKANEMSLERAIADAERSIETYTTTHLPPLDDRLR